MSWRNFFRGDLHGGGHCIPTAQQIRHTHRISFQPRQSERIIKCRLMSDPLQDSTNQLEGVSDEDRQEIILEIDRVAGENRIQVTPEVFRYSAQRNGILLPLIVNLAGILLLAAGVFLLTVLFRSEETELRDEAAAVVTAENRVIEEIRRETEAELAAKENEIAGIQAQLAAISDEREALAAEIDTRVAQREVQLRDEFNAEIEVERQRLRALDLTEEQVEARLASYVEVKEREYDQRVEQFQREVEAERIEIESELDDLERQYSATLTDATLEREQLLADSQRRLQEVEEELRAELVAQQSDFTEAQQELARLTEESERAELIRGQIRGLYLSVADAIERADYATARARLTDLRTLLNEQSILRNDTLREQRPIELFLISSLKELIDLQERFANPDAIARLSDAGLIRQVDDLVARAAGALETGETARARLLYGQAIDLIPSVAEAYGYLIETGTIDRDAELIAINEAAGAALDEARRSMEQREYAPAVRQLANILLSYPRSRFRQDAIRDIDTALSSLIEGNESERDQQTQRVAILESELADRQEEVSRLEQELEQGNEETARLSAQLRDLRAQTASSSEDTSALRARVTELERDLESAQRRVESLRDTVSARDADLSETENELLIALDELAQAQADSAQAQATVTQLTRQIEEGATGTNAAVDPEMLAELQTLRNLSERLDTVRNNYRSYQTEVSGVDADADQIQVLDAKVAFERFLSADILGEFFPGLSDEFNRFEDAYVAGGRQNALLDATDLIIELSFLDTTQERLAFLRQERRTIDNRPAFAEFVTELETLIEIAAQ